MTPEQVRVLDVLSDQPQTLAQLAERAGLSHRRDAEQAVHDLRLAGHPVISDTEGVRLSRDPAEVAERADALRRRAIHQMLTARALRATARRLAAALTPSYQVAERPSLWLDERLGRGIGGEL